MQPSLKSKGLSFCSSTSTAIIIITGLIILITHYDKIIHKTSQGSYIKQSPHPSSVMLVLDSFKFDQ